MIVSALPVLIRPRVLALKNHLKRVASSRTMLVRELLIFGMSLLVIGSMYLGTISALADLHQSTESLFIPPHLPLEMFMHLLFFLLLFSNVITALGSLYLSTDLDLVLASPISRNRFFIGKVAEITLSSSWMLIVFGFPIFFAFGTYFGAPLTYYVVGFFALIPIFLIPPLAALLAVTIFAAIIPANRTREVFVIVLALGFISLTVGSDVSAPQPSGTSSESLYRMLRLGQRFHANWLPGTWTAQTLGELLSPIGRPTWMLMAALWSTLFCIGAAARICLDRFHQGAYSKARSVALGMNIQSRRAHKLLRLCTPFLSRPTRALFSKELKIFSRDMSQALQLLLLIGLCTVYLYNFKVLRNVTLPDPTLRPWIQGFLIICNTGLGSFLVTTVCTRFVFPSVSIEGRALWILISSPVPVIDILRGKFLSWYFPVAIISSTIMTSGALAIDAEPHIVAIHSLSSVILCYGIVGLAVGLGAFFAQFDWEFSSQLATSFGSLVFLVAASILILLNLIPVSILVFLRTIRNFGYPIAPLHWYIFVVGSAVLIAILNVGAARWALHLGEGALLRHLE